MAAYYNENDPKAAEWLRSLIKEGLITDGEVDQRSIKEVQGDDLQEFDRVHLFAGIGGWDYALQLSGWPVDVPVWTGSCPCQPFSAAGKRKGTKDDRHLWPEMFRLIAECQPATIFGEQVASKAGREWLTGVFADLEGVGYAVAGADLCAAGVGAPHIRQRLWWVADSNGGNPCKKREQRSGEHGQQSKDHRAGLGVDHPESDGRIEGRSESDRRIGSQRRSESGFWSVADYLICSDEKYRPVEPGTFPLAHGISGRMAQLRGLGNAIVPQVATEFIGAYLDARVCECA